MQLAALEVRQTAERVEELAGLESAGHGVHGEVAPPHVVRDRHRRVGDDLEVTVTRPDASLPARRRQLDARRGERPDRAVAGVEANADELAVDLHVLDAAVRLER